MKPLGSKLEKMSTEKAIQLCNPLYIAIMARGSCTFKNCTLELYTFEIDTFGTCTLRCHPFGSCTFESYTSEGTTYEGKTPNSCYYYDDDGRVLFYSMIFMICHSTQCLKITEKCLI